MKIAAFSIVLLMVAGCATLDKTYDEKGNPIFHATCGAAMPESCYNLANENCPQGYITIAREGNEPIGVGVNAVTIGGNFYAVSSPETSRRELFFKCK